MIDPLGEAYISASNGYSTDRIVADPKLNGVFVRRCRERGLDQDVVELNWRLFNARKGGLLKGLRRSKRTSFPDEEEYRHASEVAARFLERREGINLDRIICDPNLAREFDSIAASIAPGYLPVQYRWAALNLRKARKLRPELLAEVIQAVAMQLGPVEDVLSENIPNDQGIYLFHSVRDTLYIGEASNLRIRIEKHLEHSDNKSLARWFWDHGMSDVQLEIRVLPANTTTRQRRALESELILSRQPIFNVKGT